MADFTHQDLTGSRFQRVSLKDAALREVDLSGALLHNVEMVGTRIRGAFMMDVEISGMLRGVRVNDVDVSEFVESELDKRYPHRAKMRPTTAEGFREAWAVLEPLWAGTVEKARALPEELLHERVDEEYSFIETLRHLVFATNAWVYRAYLGQPSPYTPYDLPHDEHEDEGSVPWDRTARPSLAEMLALRAERMATVRQVFAELTDERLTEKTTPVEGPGYPETRSYDVARCLRAVVNEEWEHRLFAERDLDLLAARQ